MDKIWKKKEWLAANGYPVKMGKGRISGANHEALSAAAAKGVRFSDYTPVKTETVEVTKGEIKEKRVRVIRDSSSTPEAASDTAWVAPDEYRYPEGQWKAVGDNGQTYGMREACNNCGLSLCGHVCNSPSVLGVPVTIVRV